jgi:hypothetical protein
MWANARPSLRGRGTFVRFRIGRRFLPGTAVRIGRRGIEWRRRCRGHSGFKRDRHGNSSSMEPNAADVSKFLLETSVDTFI